MVKKKSGLWFYIVGGVLLGIWFISHLADTGNSQVSPPSSRATPYQTPAPAPIVQPTPEATPLARFTPSPTLASPAPTPFIVRPAEMVATYRVIGIRQGDFLNLREGPGESYTIVQKLPNGLNGIKLVGASIDNGGTTWQKVDSRGVQGWAAMDYLIIDKVVQVRAAVPVGTQSTRENNPPSDDYVPKEVRLTSSVAFPVVEHGFQTGLTTPPVGTKVKLVKIVGYNVVLEYQGQQKSVSASSTDLLQRMLGTADD